MNSRKDDNTKKQETASNAETMSDLDQLALVASCVADSNVSQRPTENNVLQHRFPGFFASRYQPQTTNVSVGTHVSRPEPMEQKNGLSRIFSLRNGIVIYSKNAEQLPRVGIKRTILERTTEEGSWTSFSVMNGKVAYYKRPDPLVPANKENTSEVETSLSLQQKSSRYKRG